LYLSLFGRKYIILQHRSFGNVSPSILLLSGKGSAFNPGQGFPGFQLWCDKKSVSSVSSLFSNVRFNSGMVRLIPIKGFLAFSIMKVKPKKDKFELSDF
jgi:hypothetical protein